MKVGCGWEERRRNGAMRVRVGKSQKKSDAKGWCEGEGEGGAGGLERRGKEG